MEKELRESKEQVVELKADKVFCWLHSLLFTRRCMMTLSRLTTPTNPGLIDYASWSTCGHTRPPLRLQEKRTALLQCITSRALHAPYPDTDPEPADCHRNCHAQCGEAALLAVMGAVPLCLQPLWVTPVALSFSFGFQTVSSSIYLPSDVICGSCFH